MRNFGRIKLITKISSWFHLTMKHYRKRDAMIMSTKEQAVAVWQRADTVCFDVDSTLLKDEGLDELAEFCGVGQEVKELTRQAMADGLNFRKALEKRLELFKPSRQCIEEFRESHQIVFSNGVQDLISLLQQRGINVYLVSGGFQSLIEPAAQKLGIPSSNIFSNKFAFSYHGDYIGFDTTQLTSDSGGKTKVAALLKKTSKNLVFIGDGMTDLEACPPADCFIGYGGNVVREKVKAAAAWYITDFQELINLLKN